MGARVLGVGLTGPELTELERRILEETAPYAIVLFARNVASPSQLRELVAEIKEISSEPPLVLIDEEGGRVDRLRHLIPGFPAAEEVGELPQGAEMAHGFGYVIGRALRYFGIDVNLAPVVDLRREVPARGLERRYFGGDPVAVTRLAGAFIDGGAAAGTASCLKHFPGIGTGTADPHYGASVVDLEREQLLAEDLLPYRELGEKAGSIMIGHSIYPALDPDTPGTLSRVIGTDVLRGEVGFKGLAFSDDMEMHAVSDLGTYEDIAERALVAGNDIVLFCSQIERVPSLMHHIEEASRRDESIAARYEEAVRRSIEFRRHCESIQAAVPPAPTFEAVVAELGEFRERFDATRPEGSLPAGVDERRRPERSGGTGKTGREEWT